MGHVPQQLLLQYNSALQTLRHVVKRTAQLAQFVLSTGGVKGHPRVQLIGTPGIGLLAQLIERHDQQPVQADAQQQGKQAWNHTIGHHAPDHLITPRHKTLWQFNDQRTGTRIYRKRDLEPRQALDVAADRPIQAPQERQALAFRSGQWIAAQRLQVVAYYADPRAFLFAHRLQPRINTGMAATVPGLLGAHRITTQRDPRLVGQIRVLLLHVPAPGPTEPDHQQTEGNQQAGELPK